MSLFMPLSPGDGDGDAILVMCRDLRRAISPRYRDGGVRFCGRGDSRRRLRLVVENVREHEARCLS